MTRLLLLALLFAACRQLSADSERIAFPHNPSVLDLKRDFGAPGRGMADDSSALQPGIAASSCTGRDSSMENRLLPNRTYPVTSNLLVRAAAGPWVFGESGAGMGSPLDRSGVKTATSASPSPSPAPHLGLEPFDWQGSGAFDTYKWRGFLLCNNRWGGGNGRIWFKDHGNRWAFWTEHSDDLNDGQVKSFPHAGIGWMWGNWAPNQALPVRLGELAVAKSDWIVTLPETKTNQSYVVYYQLYTSALPDPKNDAAKISGDLAIIIHREDFPFEAWGKTLGEFDVGGRKWRVVQKAPAVGKSTYIIMIPVTPVAKREGHRLTVENFDLKPCIDFCVAQGLYRPTDYLLTIQVGWESRVLHGVLRSDDLRLTVGKKGAQPLRLPLAH